jgi:hypothetical protein
MSSNCNTQSNTNNKSTCIHEWRLQIDYADPYFKADKYCIKCTTSISVQLPPWTRVLKIEIDKAVNNTTTTTTTPSSEGFVIAHSFFKNMSTFYFLSAIQNNQQLQSARTQFRALTEDDQDRMIQNCEDNECAACGFLCCPFYDPLHFHHDGCPMCATSITQNSHQM